MTVDQIFFASPNVILTS